MLRTPTEVNNFWFEKTINGSIDDVNAMMAKWFFRKDASFEDAQMKHGSLLSVLADRSRDPSFNTSSSNNSSNSTNSSSSGDSGDIDMSLWDYKTCSRAAMALVILFDQFSRCIHRGTSLAFAYDEKAAEIINYIIQRGDWLLGKYSPIERFFLCVAIQHSEKLADQECGVRVIAPSIGNGAPSDVGLFFSSLKGFPMEHYEVVKRFGRFPHRNELLGRENSAAEDAWLQSDECPGWAKSQAKKM